jgi:regulator of sigma E protease
MSWLIAGIAFILVLGVAVNIHEFGHFIVAKLLKIRVEAYSFFGLGPRIWGKRIGNTDYRISAIPIGAFVKLYGDEANEPLEGKDKTVAEDVPESELYELRPRWQKFLVMVGGPVMNILLALGIMFASALINGIVERPSSPTISQIMPNSAAQEAGLQYGDRIVSFNNKNNPTWKDIEDEVLLSPNPPKPLPMVIERNGQRQTLAITPKIVKFNSDDVGDLGIVPDYGTPVPVIITQVLLNAPGDKAGLKPGDRLLTINGESIRNSAQATHLIRTSKGETVPVTIERQGQRVELKASPESVKNEKGEEIRKLGLSLDDNPPRASVGITRAASFAVSENWRIMRLTGRALKQLFAGERKANSVVSGPVGIFVVTKQAASLGLEALIFMLALLSLNLGVFNLLPIPMLDGGQIFVLAVEGLLARFGVKLSQTIHLRIQQVGIVFILLLTVFVFASDIMKLASNWRGSGNQQPPPATTPQK